MKFKILFIFILLLFSSRVLAQEHASDEDSMKTAGFWISRHPSPDALIMNPEAIARFNSRLCNDNKLTKDIFDIIQEQRTQTLSDDLEKIFEDIRSKDYYTAADVRDDEDFMDDVKGNMNLSGVVTGVAPRYGLVVHFAPQRFLPTNEGLYEHEKDYDFDQLQNSGLDVGTPVAVIHTSEDGLWYYVMTDISDGWVEAKNIALGDVDQVKEFAQDKNFVVVIRPKADIFGNESMTDYNGYLRMGMRLPLSSVGVGHVTVKVPAMDADGTLAIREGYMNAEDVNIGFLAFSARNIYRQALMMLNEPYGWGDMHGEQDCSRFLQMVFATVGIVLPRDSKDQAQVSSSPVNFDKKSTDTAKIASLVKTPAAISLLAMKGHILLYLGAVNGKPYVIHETTSYKQMKDKKEITYSFNKVMISDLSLGQGSSKGSLLRRLTRIVPIE